MSHFTVLVIGNNPEAQLAPFQENNMGDCPNEYLKFNDEEDDYKKRYETESVSCVKTIDGGLYSKWDNKFKVQTTDFFEQNEFEYPEGSEEIAVPFTQNYASFEQFMDDHCGYSERDKTQGRYGYWENPNAKWDWYALGGRWQGMLRLKKESSDALVGSKSLLDKNQLYEPGYADSASKGGIDFEAMQESAMAKAAINYDQLEEVTRGLPLPNIKTMYEVQEGETQPRIVGEYYNQLWTKAVRKLSFANIFEDPSEQFMVFKGGREAFIQEARDNAFCTFAAIKNGKWYERGDMGWWGCVSDEKDQVAWHTEFMNILNDVSDDTIISVYDCHI